MISDDWTQQNAITAAEAKGRAAYIAGANPIDNPHDNILARADSG